MKKMRDLPEAAIDESGGVQIIAFRRVIAFILLFPRVLLSPRFFFSEISIHHRNVLAACIYLIGACLLAAFVGVSMAIVEEVDWVRSFLIRSIFGFVSTLACGVLMALIWRPSRLMDRASDFYCIYLYHSGTFNLTAVLLMASYPESAVVLSTTCGILAPEFRQLPDFSVCSIVFLLDEIWYSYIVLAVTSLVLSAWGVAAWLAYRDMFFEKFIGTIFKFFLFVIGSLLIGLYFSIPVIAVQMNVLADLLMAT